MAGDIGTITVELESPYNDGVKELIEELDNYQSSLYPKESNHFLGIELLAEPNIRFFVARRRGEALGIGALRIDQSGYGEMKRMFVQPRARGHKIGKRILESIEETARLQELSCLRLETGIHQHAALALYRSAGFTERGPFGEYHNDPLSIYMEKTL